MKIFKNLKFKSGVMLLSLIMAMLVCFTFVSAEEAVSLDEVKFFSEGEQIYTKTAGGITAYAYLSNDDVVAKDVWLVASAYNGNRLSDVSVSKESVPGGCVREKFSTSEITVKSGEEFKVLVWDDGFAPICTPVFLTDTSCEKSIDTFALTLGSKTYKGYIDNETNVITVPIDTKYANAVLETGDTTNNIKEYSAKDEAQLSAEEVEIYLENAIPSATYNGVLDKELSASDFSAPSSYKVTAADGSSTTYTVQVDRNAIKYANNFTVLGGNGGMATNTGTNRGGMIDLNTKYIGANGSDTWYWVNEIWSGSEFNSTHAGFKTAITTDGDNKYFTLDATGRTGTPTENDIAFYLYTRYMNFRDNFGSHIMGTGYTSRFKVRYSGVTNGVGTILPSYYDLSSNSITDNVTKGIMLYLKANGEGKLSAYAKDGSREIKLSNETFNQGEWLDVMVTYEINQNMITPAEGATYYNSSMSFYINDKYLGSVNIKSGVGTVRLTDRTLNIGFGYTSDKMKMDMDDYFFSMTPSVPEAKLYSAKLMVEDKAYDGLIKDNTIKFEVTNALSELANVKLIAGCEDIGRDEKFVNLSSGSASVTIGKVTYTVVAEKVTEKINAAFETGEFSAYDGSNAAYMISTEKGITGTKALLAQSLRDGGTTISVKEGKLVIYKLTNDSNSGDTCQIFVPTNDTNVKGFSVSYDLCIGSDSVITYDRPLHITMPDTLKTYFYGKSSELVDRYYTSSGGVTALTSNLFTNGKTYRYTYVYRLDGSTVVAEMYVNGKYAGTPTQAILSSSGTISDMLFDVNRNNYTGTISIDNFICNIIK